MKKNIRGNIGIKNFNKTSEKRISEVIKKIDNKRSNEEHVK